MTAIEHNGSKWLGEAPDSIETLLDVLTREPLDPRFEEYGNFVYPLDGEHGYNDPAYAGTFRFFGNFALLSHSFGITSDEADTIKVLTDAIRANQAREDYQKIRREWYTPCERCGKFARSCKCGEITQGVLAFAESVEGLIMTATLTSGVFEITGGGLKPITNSGLYVGAGQIYWYGYSNSPDMVICSGVDACSEAESRYVHGGAWVRFYSYPYRKERRESLTIFRDLATRGSACKVRQLEHYAARMPAEDMPPWISTTLTGLRAVLAGIPALGKVDHRDYQPVTLRVAYHGKGDGWSEFEQTWPHDVSGQDNGGPQPVLEMHVSRSHAHSIVKWCGSGDGRDFVSHGISED